MKMVDEKEDSVNSSEADKPNLVDQKENVDEDDNKDIDDNSDYYTEKFSKLNEEEDGMGLNLPQAVKICFKKYRKKIALYFSKYLQ